MARTHDLFETGVGGTYIQTIAPSGYDILINGSNHYLNFNTIVGSSGYGIRDNAGTIEFKNSGGSWVAIGSGGGSSPLTTKGDIYTFSTVDARLPVGSNGQVLSVDLTQATGLKWIPLSGGGDMVQATYDPAGIGEQLVGLTASQTLTNKTLTAPVINAGTFGTSITGSYLTASQILITDASKNIISAAVATYPSLTELTYLKGVTSAIQTQLDAKGAGTVTSVTSANTDATVANTTTTPVITIVSAPKWTTARTLAGNSVDGSANVSFANKFIVQGTTDAGLSAAQFLGALGTGIVKNTTTTGVLSIAVAGDFPTLNQNTTGSAATLTTTRTIWGQNFNGSANVIGDITLGTGNITMTGSIAATGARVTKGWFTDIESTNMPTVGGTAILTSLTAPQFTTIELGHASDTTISRVSAGLIAVEGITLVDVSTAQTLTTKTLTSPIIQTLPVLAAATLVKYTIPTSDDTATGDITNEFNSGYSSTAIGDLVYLDSSATWQKADADASAATYSGFLGIALEVKASGQAVKVLLRGFIYESTAFPTFTIGSPIYMSATAGAVTQTAPAGTDAATRIIGYAIHADKMYFNPENDFITHS